MLIDSRSAALVVVDMQEKILSAVSRPEATLDSCLWVTRFAKRLDLPILFTEQNRQSLGPTTPSLTAISPTAPTLEKMAFSCWAEPGIAKALRAYNPVILIGIESHICVLQTALDLKQTASRSVFVVETAVDSRRSSDKAAALSRMAQAGVSIITEEMLLFEALRTAGRPDFREISKQFVRRDVHGSS